MDRLNPSIQAALLLPELLLDKALCPAQFVKSVSSESQLWRENKRKNTGFLKFYKKELASCYYKVLSCRIIGLFGPICL